MTTFSQDSWRLGQNSKPHPTQHEAGILTTAVRLSVLAEWLTFPTHIREVTGSFLGPEPNDILEDSCYFIVMVCVPHVPPISLSLIFILIVLGKG